MVWASSETTLGLPFEIPPRYAPVDEDHYPFPTTTYALSKVASETIAGHIAQWSGTPVALRFSNIMAPADYQEFPSFWGDPTERKWNLWGYIDERDVAAACRLALEAPADAVAGNPTSSSPPPTPSWTARRPSCSPRSSRCPADGEVGEFGTLLAIDRAGDVLASNPPFLARPRARLATRS